MDSKQHENVMPELGLTDDEREGVYHLYSRVLADEFVLRLKLRKFHWNITGPQFHALHEMFEEQYDHLTVEIDEIAERIRQYGFYAPGTMDEFGEMTRVEAPPADYPNATEMVEQLVDDHEQMIRNLRDDREAAIDEYNDEAAEDYFIGLLQDHQKMAWMLRAFLQGDQV